MNGRGGEHRPVLLAEVLEALRVRPQGVYVDATFGRGGHARAILNRLGEGARLLVLDRDPEAVAHARATVGRDPRVTVVHGNFSMLSAQVAMQGWSGTVDGIVLDLGVSSPQLEDPERGFSFTRAGPLDMRMDPTQGESAAQWLALVPEQELARVLRDYGEERFARRVARALVKARRIQPLTTTQQLADVVARAVPTRERAKHPATRAFQAIRIAVNAELEHLRQALSQSVAVLAPGGRLVVVSFHSLEDRLVKRFMRERSRSPGELLPPGLAVPEAAGGGELRVIGRPRRPGASELEDNPRARSAVLRVAERNP